MRYKDERGEYKENNQGQYNITVINKLLWEHRRRSHWRLPAGFTGEVLFELEMANVFFLVEKGREGRGFGAAWRVCVKALRRKGTRQV